MANHPVISSTADRCICGSLRAVLADRERELLDLKGPCSSAACVLHYAHSGPCNVQAPSSTSKVHTPFDDDGVLYCGWATDNGIVNGCGHIWPCPTERVRTAAPSTPEGGPSGG